MMQDRTAQRRAASRRRWRATSDVARVAVTTALLLVPGDAWAQAVDGPPAAANPAAANPAAASPFLNGAALSWHWSLPFLGLLLTIALGPSLFPRIWRAHAGKLAFVWATLAVAPLAALYGMPIISAELVRLMLKDYASFMVLMVTLYVVAGGLLLTGNLRGTPLTNVALLAAGTVLASVIGTMAAVVILIRPLIRANAHRLHNVHVIVFFIFLVANVGGALSWFGDPPLYAGFQRGVAFFWTTEHILLETAVAVGALLVLFVVLDLILFLRDRRVATVGESVPARDLRLRGQLNIVLIIAIICTLYISEAWDSGIAFEFHGTSFALQQILRDVVLLLIAVISLILTREEHREVNGFSWEPIAIVAILYAAIFVCLIPVLAMMRAGPAGSFDWLMSAVDGETGAAQAVGYFWVSGLLSAVISNVPSYVLLFEGTGGNAATLVGTLAPTLAAISLGTVFMGALSYIGNAPNYIVYDIALERGIKMPGFFGYLLWSGAFLVPILVLVTYVFAGWI